jgi:hypothetical protein
MGASLAASLAAVAALGSAVAADPPAPCAGVPQITDACGDGHHANTDVLDAWFSEAAGSLQAVIRVRNAVWEPVHDDSEAAGFALLYTQGGAIRYVRAEAPRGADVRYDQGTWTAAGGFATSGPTTGTAITGLKGSVTLNVPGASAGAVLARPFVLTYDGTDGSEPHWVDRAPGGVTPAGSEYGADFIVGACGATQPPADPSDPGDPAPDPGTGPVPTVPDGSVTAVQLFAPKRKVGGGRVRVRGSVAPARGGVPVELSGTARRSFERTLITAEDGTFRAAVRLKETTGLRAVAGGVGSQTRTVTVKSRIKLKLRRTRSGRVRVSGRVRPKLPGRVLLLRRGGVRTLAKTRPRSNGRYRMPAKRLRKGRYQVVYIPSRSRALRSVSKPGVVR